jgi:hypothetical protein
MNARLTGVLMGVGALGAFFAPGAAFAQDAGTVPSCNDATMFPNPIYLSGSTAFEPATQATVADYSGPAQAMLFVVPTAATGAPASITAEEAQNVWGFGMRGMISPWLVESAIQQRSATSGTQNVIARSINVLASSLDGTMHASGGALVTTLTGMNPSVTIADPNTAIGFLAADAFDSQRAKMHALAFRGLEQTQAYYADSAADAFDKRNVRDGHYLAWGCR